MAASQLCSQRRGEDEESAESPSSRGGRKLVGDMHRSCHQLNELGLKQEGREEQAKSPFRTWPNQQQAPDLAGVLPLSQGVPRLIAGSDHSQPEGEDDARGSRASPARPWFLGPLAITFEFDEGVAEQEPWENKHGLRKEGWGRKVPWEHPQQPNPLHKWPSRLLAWSLLLIPRTLLQRRLRKPKLHVQEREAAFLKENRLACKSFAVLANLLVRCTSTSIIKDLDASYTAELNKVEKERHAVGVKNFDSMEEVDEKMKTMEGCVCKAAQALPWVSFGLSPRKGRL